jgi:hypothetical protein
MRTPRSLVGPAVVLAIAMAAAASAQVIKDEAVDTADTGKIVAIDARAKTFTLEGAEGEHGVYQVNDDTTIMSGDKEVALSDLRAGMHVVVDVDRREGRKIATYVEVVDAGGS